MRRTLFIMLVFVSSILTIVACSCNDAGSSREKIIAGPDSTERISRGEYLVNISGCDDCHSPKKMGPNGPEIIPELRFSGYPSTRPIAHANMDVLKDGWIAMLGSDGTSAVGPWGMSFSANITSDESGIGNWSEENFIRAIRKGKFKGMEGSRDLLPPMPWFAYKNMTDEDLRAVYAFLKSTKPVSNVVPAWIQVPDINKKPSHK
ncbi:MAG: c-type cytochrome [Bacteroidota bacterium]